MSRAARLRCFEAINTRFIVDFAGLSASVPLRDARQQMTTWVWASLKHCVMSLRFSLSARAVVAPSNVNEL